MRVGDFITYGPKSTIKAGDSVVDGPYMFFTSSSEENKRCQKYQFDCEGIIMGTGGNATLHYYSGKFSVSTDCVVLIPDSRVKCKYLYYFFLANMHILEEGFKGAGLKHTNKNYISSIEFGDIPSIPEQERIITVLDTVAHVLLDRRTELLTLDTIIKARFVEMFGDPIHPIEHENLGEVAIVERGRFSPRPRNDPKYYNGEYPFIQTGDIASCNHRLYDFRQTLNASGIKVSKRFDKGTIVIAIVGATIGATAILQRAVYAPDSVIGITPHTYNNVFLETLLQFWQPELQAIAPESARANINLSILDGIPIIKANLLHQQQFAAFVSQVDKSKLSIQQGLEKLETLKKSLMQQYFG